MKTKSILQLNDQRSQRLPFTCMAVIISACLVACGTPLITIAQGQADKRLELADQYFTAGEYVTAASLYEQFLHPINVSKGHSDFPLNSKRNTQGRMGAYKNKIEIMMKQADSYRLAHLWNEAAGLYQHCFEKDPEQFASALYWLAVCQRSLGQVDVAQESIDRFLKKFTTIGLLTQEAEKERQVIQYIKKQRARPDTALFRVEKMSFPFSHEGGIFSPVFGANSMIFTGTQSGSVNEGKNPYYNSLFQSVVVDGRLLQKEQVFIEAGNPEMSQATPALSADGNYLYFTQGKRGSEGMTTDIYFSKKSTNGWSSPILLSSLKLKGSNNRQPFCTSDGKYLFFASDREGGWGGYDIWYAPLNEDGTTGQPLNAGSQLNTPDNEQTPFIHSSTNTIVFSSDRRPSMGGYDLYMAKRNGTEWNQVENLGYPVNSPGDDLYFFASEKHDVLTNALFSSDRGSDCCLSLYSVTRSPKTKMISGLVIDCNNHQPLAEAEVILTTAEGHNRKMITGTDGTYSFEMPGEAAQHQISANREKYIERSAGITVERVNNAHWKTDTLFNTALCLEKKLVIKVENVVTVYFEFDKDEITEQAMGQLDSIYTVLGQDTTVTIQISGYTDGLGSVEYNKKLSDRRAKACADYLVQSGIDPARISFESFGACCPVEMELLNGRDNPDGRSKNRRALININKE